MKTINLVAVLSVLTLISGCASMEEQMRNDACNKDRAYEHGLNDAAAQKPMNSGFSSVCDLNQRDVIGQSYKEGYNAGMAHRNARRANQQQSSGSGNRPLVNINLGGTQHIGGSPENTASKTAYFCETEVFMQRYKAFGPTELEARENVFGQCTQHNHKMHCENISCRENE